MRVKRGQVWSIADNRRGRVTVKVKSVRGPSVRAIVARTGVEVVLRRKVLEHGQRAARLLTDTGKPKKPVVLSLPPLSKAERRTASDLRKQKPPRGMQAFDERSEKMRRLMDEEHLTSTVIAQRMGCSPSTVKDRVSRARLARRDARHLEAAFG